MRRIKRHVQIERRVPFRLQNFLRKVADRVFFQLRHRRPIRKPPLRLLVLDPNESSGRSQYCTPCVDRIRPGILVTRLGEHPAVHAKALVSFTPFLASESTFGVTISLQP